MEKKRKVYAPFSLTSEAGVAQTPVEGYIDVNQTIYPTVNTGTINENGIWSGVKSNDTEFIGLTTHLAIPDSGTVLFPDTNNHPSIDMEGFTDIMIAFKAITTASNVTARIEAVSGPDTIRVANLEPVNAGEVIRGNLFGQTMSEFNNVLVDSSETLTANVWTIFTLQNILKNRQNFQFKVTNNSGGQRSLEFAFRRLI